MIALLFMPGIVVFVLASPVLLPMLAVVEWRARKRLKRSVTDFACIRCGTLLTAQAVRLADAYRKQQAIDLQRRFPQTRFRFMEAVHAICPACGAKYRYEEVQGVLLPVDDSVPGPVA